MKYLLRVMKDGVLYEEYDTTVIVEETGDFYRKEFTLKGKGCMVNVADWYYPTRLQLELILSCMVGYQVSEDLEKGFICWINGK